MPWFVEHASEIVRPRVEELTLRACEEARERICRNPQRVLLLPPDITRMHSGSGWVTEIMYDHFTAGGADCRVIPTLGQHIPHTEKENRAMFGAIPNDRIHAHDWRGGCVRVGKLSAEFVAETTHGAANWEVPIDLNTMTMREPWDIVINIGHVVPHEVLGFANHNKNYFIGLAGKETICTTHMAAACCGIENNLGCLITPVRALFNRAEEEFLGGIPDFYFQLTLARSFDDRLVHTGVHVGDDLETYLGAARQSRRENITVFDKPIENIVCVMQGDEFFSTWVANKSIYRTRMAIADGGTLTVIAPGLTRFGEQPEVEEIIRRHGYRGTPHTMEQYRKDPLMQDFAHATAHLIHSSSEGRFTIRYAPGGVSRADIEQIGFDYMPIDEAIARYKPYDSRQGFHTTDDGQEYYFIPTPSAGLWAAKEKLAGRKDSFENV
ncbi:MAG: lactate racemase domain-containing protein [Planctomycetota bacterium]|nr:MAG: DUF2088 domain-containing protein [Planctomycetaceae bacterium]